jgi:hypothetical protein
VKALNELWAEAHVDFAILVARLKLCPFKTFEALIARLKSFSFQDIDSKNFKALIHKN